MTTPGNPLEKFLVFLGKSKVFQLSINCILSFILGSTFSANVFTTPVENAANPPHSLDGVWPFSIGLFFFFSCFVSIPIGVFLDSAEDVKKILRKIATLSGIFFMLWGIAAFGVFTSSPLITSIGNMIISIPLAGLCIFVIEHATYWLPGQSGQAIGIVNISIGIGTIATASLFNKLIDLFGVSAAIAASGVILGVLTILCAMLISIPENYRSSEFIETLNERGPSLIYNFPRLTWRSMLRHPTFWVYVFIIISKRMTFPLLSYFFRIGHTYQVSQLTLLRWFQWANLFSLIFNYASAVGTDYLKTNTGVLSSGARNLACIMLFGQVAGYVLLTQLLDLKDFVGWAIVVSATLTITQAHLGIATLLAVDLFGRENMALVFGLGGQPALGLGEGISTVLIGWVDGLNGGVVESPRHYNLFYLIGAVWSALAFASLVYLRRNIRRGSLS